MWLFILAIVLVIAVATTIALGSNWVVLWLAQKDVWYSPFRQKPLEGQILYILRGGLNGPLSRILHSVSGRKLNSSGELEVGTEIITDYFEKELGVVWVGFFRKIHQRTVKYTAYEHPSDLTKTGIVDKKREETFFQTAMAIRLEGAFTKGNFPVNATIAFTMRLYAPAKAEFLAGKPEVQAMSAVETVAREYIGTRTVEELRNEKNVAGNQDLAGQILEANEGLATDPDKMALRDHFGIEIVEPFFPDFDLVSGDGEYAEATRSVEVARLKADAVIEEARGIRTRGEAEAHAIKAKNAARSAYPGGPVFALADSIEVARPSTLVLGDGLIAVTPTPGGQRTPSPSNPSTTSGPAPRAPTPPAIPPIAKP